jgi:hypothetical protein
METVLLAKRMLTAESQTESKERTMPIDIFSNDAAEKAAEFCTAHLCRDCAKCYPTCDGKKIVFGIDRDPTARGKNADTILECDGHVSRLQSFENWLARGGHALLPHQKEIAKAMFSLGWASGKSFLIRKMYEYDSLPEQHMPFFVADSQTEPKETKC